MQLIRLTSSSKTTTSLSLLRDRKYRNTTTTSNSGNGGRCRIFISTYRIVLFVVVAVLVVSFSNNHGVGYSSSMRIPVVTFYYASAFHVNTNQQQRVPVPVVLPNHHLQLPQLQYQYFPFVTQRKSSSSSSSSSSRPPFLLAETAVAADNSEANQKGNQFDLAIALLCGGLAFDAYVEPDENSSRWERGSSGVNVAFCSIPYTRSIYRGLLEFTIQKVTHLPSVSENDSTAERIISGDGIDAYVLAAILEGQWVEDIQKIENQPYISSNGMLDITGAAHVSRTSTCWSTITKEKSDLSYQRKGVALPYHIPAPSTSLLDMFGSNKEKNLGAQAIWPQQNSSGGDAVVEPPIYLYVQDPSTARIVLTVMDDDRIATTLGGKSGNDTNTNGQPIGLTYKKLAELIPQAGWTQDKFIQEMKQRVIAEIERNKDKIRSSSTSSVEDIIQRKIQQSMEFVWEGSIPLLRKPRKRDKGNQQWMAAAAGAAIAGPIGAATGAVLANMYESPVSGQIHCRIKYTPLPPPSNTVTTKTATASAISKSNQRTKYIVKGGTPGVDWGTLHTKYHQKKTPDVDTDSDVTVSANIRMESNYRGVDYQGISSDLEYCFSISHKKTGATCAVYRSIRYKSVFVSFRGTCAPIDLVTDASLIQETWIEGEDEKIQILPKVHVGFRSSMNSISRRLKELILAIPAPGDDISQYDMYVTGHSLGGALSTLFTADIGQYGIDAGRGLPQLEQSEPWWKSVVNVFSGSKSGIHIDYNMKGPPRPKSLRMYNFGSPRVGNVAFSDLFDALVAEGHIDQAYRVVNGDDVVARLPRTLNALVLGNINYEHVGTTVLLTQPEANDNENTILSNSETWLWIEGESDDNKCPVRDGEMLISPIAEGTLLNDLITATREGFAIGQTGTATPATIENDSDDSTTNAGLMDRLSIMAGKVTDRVKNMNASDLASIIGIDQSFTTREIRIIQSLMQGNALAHHLEDQYYAGMGRASGFLARVNEDIVELPQSTMPNGQVRK